MKIKKKDVSISRKSIASMRREVGSFLDHTFGLLKRLGPLMGLVGLWIFLSLTQSRFLTPINIEHIALQTSTLIILATGMTFVIISGEIDLSVGAIMAWSGCVTAYMVILAKVNWILGILIGLGAGTLGGVISGFFVARFGIPAFITSLVIANVYRGFALIITEGQAIWGFPKPVAFIGQGKIGPFPTPVIIAIVVVLASQFVLIRRRFGLYCYATGGNKEATRNCGINPSAIKWAALVTCSFLASIAGIISAGRMDAAHAMIGGEDDLMNTIAAVVIGGTSLMGGVGTLLGSVIGALIIGTMRNGLNLLGISTYWQFVCIGIIILLAVLAKYWKVIRPG
ncbi:MAG: ABC transporter permease [bacterium]